MVEMVIAHFNLPCYYFSGIMSVCPKLFKPKRNATGSYVKEWKCILTEFVAELH
jgi:hypothetical protein